jgi:PTS system nitrogen regulatory IIA component
VKGHPQRGPLYSFNSVLSFDSPWIAEDIPQSSLADFDSTKVRPFEGAYMKLRELFTADVVNLNLTAETKDETVKQLVSLLQLDEKSKGILYKTLKRRENLGSTGIGRGIAIPHCRSLVVNRLQLAYGRTPGGVEFKAIDDEPVYNFFLIVAPPLEVSNQYLPVLGKIAQFAKDDDVPGLLADLESPDDFLKLLDERAT